MRVFEEKQEELEHYGQHGVYCQSQRWPGKPVMDIQIIMKSLTDAKELIQSVMEELKKSQKSA